METPQAKLTDWATLSKDVHVGQVGHPCWVARLTACATAAVAATAAVGYSKIYPDDPDVERKYGDCCLLMSIGLAADDSWEGYFWTFDELKDIANCLTAARVRLTLKDLYLYRLERAGIHKIYYDTLVEAIRCAFSNPANLCNIAASLQQVRRGCNDTESHALPCCL